jgi:hypothetical protein
VWKFNLLFDCILPKISPFPSGVTTMGSDRTNPGAPNHNGPNGGPQAVEQKHWPGPLICHNVVFWPSEFCKISPQSLGNGISETLDSKIFRMSKPWTPRKLVHIRRSTRAFGTSTRGGAIENFEPGAPWYNVTPLPFPPRQRCWITLKIWGKLMSTLGGGEWSKNLVKLVECILLKFRPQLLTVLPTIEWWRRYGPL